MKVALRLLLLLGFAALGLFLFREVPRSVTLVYAIQDAPAVRTVDVEIRKGDAAVRQAEFRFPAGAPSELRHEVRLPDGEYRVAVRVQRAGGVPDRVLLPVTVSESGPIVLPIGAPRARTD